MTDTLPRETLLTSNSQTLYKGQFVTLYVSCPLSSSVLLLVFCRTHQLCDSAWRTESSRWLRTSVHPRGGHYIFHSPTPYPHSAPPHHNQGWTKRPHCLWDKKGNIWKLLILLEKLQHMTFWLNTFWSVISEGTWWTDLITERCGHRFTQHNYQTLFCPRSRILIL